MDQLSQNQASFIPRKALGREPATQDRPVSLFLFLATLVFTISVLGAGGIFLYKYVLSRSIEASSVYLDQRKDALEPDTINDLLRTGKRLRVSAELLNNHLAAGPVFELLENLTLKSVRFSKFDYAVNDDMSAAIKLSGEARSYGSVALQADIFGSEKRFIKNVVFSNLNLDDRGNVTFDAVLDLDRDLINYKKSLARDKISSSIPAE